MRLTKGREKAKNLHIHRKIPQLEGNLEVWVAIFLDAERNKRMGCEKGEIQIPEQTIDKSPIRKDGRRVLPRQTKRNKCKSHCGENHEQAAMKFSCHVFHRKQLSFFLLMWYLRRKGLMGIEMPMYRRWY